MSRYKLRSPDQSWPVRFALGLYEFAASLQLAVVLIFLMAVVLAYATGVESWYGTPAVQFGVYGTWWFTLLGALLAVNIFCAAAIRYPWKRHQTGFVITHIGLLTLLFGCLLSRERGIDAQIPIFEGGKNHVAYEDSQHFELAVRKNGAGSSASLDSSALHETVIRVPFRAGPFSWDAYDHGRSDRSTTKTASGASEPKELQLAPFPWALASRSQGVLYDQDGVKLEVLDYYSDSDLIDSPFVRLAISMPKRTMMGSDGRERKIEAGEMPLELRVRSTAITAYPWGVADRQRAGGGEVVFMLAGNEPATKAFLLAAPEGELGEHGQLVLVVDGQPHRIDVAKSVGQRIPLGESGVEVELTRRLANVTIDPETPRGEVRWMESPHESDGLSPAVELLVRKGDGEPETMIVMADSPEYNIPAYKHGVYGAYWFDHGEKSAEERMAGASRQRIDIIQGADKKLYYRYWNGKQLAANGPLPADGAKVDAFAMPIGTLKMRVERFVPSTGSEPERQVVALPFDKKTTPVNAFRAAKVRLTVDDHGEEFWVRSTPPTAAADATLSESERRTVAGDGRQVSVTMPLDQVRLGFRIGLRDFEMRLDPGTSQPSHYSSYVDFVDAEDDDIKLVSNEFITMNAPVDYRDPKSGRTYRLFQESFQGPWKPGDPVFESIVAPGDDRDLLYVSVLTVNLDPGRGAKYVGCLLVVLGIATMFYMRAYFFKPNKRVEAAAAPQPAHRGGRARR